MVWSKLFHLGDLSLTLPTGCAIAAWLLASRAWRAAVGWSLVFGLALALVAATKVAFLGWGTGLPALGYKAVSGHAAGFTATFPTLCWLLTRRCTPHLRAGAAVGTLGLGIVVAAALVHAGEHTPAEAIAGWLIGMAAFLGAVCLAGDVPAPPTGKTLACAGLVFGATAWAIHSVSVGYWLIRLALALSGNHYPYRWDTCFSRPPIPCGGIHVRHASSLDPMAATEPARPRNRVFHADLPAAWPGGVAGRGGTPARRSLSRPARHRQSTR